MWYGSNLANALKDISLERAFQKPAHGSHNIYEMVMHLVCWRVFAIEMLLGNAAYKVEINSEQDWPVNYEATEANWKSASKQLEKTQVQLLQLLEQFEDYKLGDLVPGRAFKFHALLNGLLHHDIYHAGQIAILKK